MLFHSSTPAAAAAVLLVGSWDDPNSPVGPTTPVPPSNATMPEAYSRSIPKAWNTSVSDFDRVVGSEYKGKPETYTNYHLDQVMAGNGTVNICLRWDSQQPLNDTLRAALEKSYEYNYQRWFTWLEGYDNFPHDEVKVKIVGFAVPDKEIFQSSTDDIDLYVNVSGYAPPGYPAAPDCDNRCWRKNHLDDNYDDCSGTPYSHYWYIREDGSEWEGGSAGPDGVNYNLKGWEAVGSKRLEWPTLQHEIGHGLFFYDFRSRKLDQEFPSPPPDPDDDLPPTYVPENAQDVMVMALYSPGFPYNPPVPTDWEGWMMRDFWSRFSRIRGWQSDA